MKLVLLGSVDAGKTTFYRRYFEGTILQKLNRTEKIRVLPFKLKDKTVYLLDTPGHKALYRFKQISATMADLVLYIVDCQSMDLSALETLGPNCLVILNKIDTCEFYKDLQKSSLKEVLGDPKLRNLLHKELSRIIGKKEQIAPFLDNDSERTVAFPVSLKTGFGLAELESFICNFYLPRFKSERTYLYLENSSSKKKEYRMLGPSKADPVLRLQKVQYPLKNLFDYNPYSKYYTLSSENFRYLSAGELLQVFDRGQEGVSEVPIMDLKPQKMFFPELRALVQKVDTSKYEFLVRSESSLRVETMEAVLKDLNLKSKVVQISLAKFNQLKKEDQVYLEWTNTPKKCQECAYSRDSLYELIDDLTNFFTAQKTKIDNQMRSKVLEQSLGELLEHNLFKQDKKELVVGYNLIFGTLKVGPVVLFSSEGQEVEATVESIKQKNSSYNSWNKKQSCAVKVKCSNTFDLLKRRQLYVRSVGLKELLENPLPIEEFSQMKRYYETILGRD